MFIYGIHTVIPQVQLRPCRAMKYVNQSKREDIRVLKNQNPQENVKHLGGPQKKPEVDSQCQTTQRNVVDPSVPGVETPETSAILPKTSRYGPSTRGETPKNVSECNCVAVVHSPPGSTKNKRKIMYCSA